MTVHGHVIFSIRSRGMFLKGHVLDNPVHNTRVFESFLRPNGDLPVLIVLGGNIFFADLTFIILHSV